MTSMPVNSVPSGSIRYWDLNESGGTNIFDSIVGAQGMIDGATWETGINETGLLFDGVDDYVQIPDSPELRPSTLSLSFWINPIIISDCGLIIKRTGTNTNEDANWQAEMKANGDIKFSYHDGSSWEVFVTDTQPIQDIGTWYNIVMTFDSGNIDIYVDGTLKNSGGGYPPLNTTHTSPVQFGRGGPGYFNGIMDDIAIYDRALSENEILADFQSYDLADPSSLDPIPGIPDPTTSSFTGNLVAHWDFDFMKSSDVLDVSGNSNDASTSGGAGYGKGVFWDSFIFTGENFMEIPNTDDLNMEAFTIEFWFYQTEYGTPNARILEKGGYQVGGGYGIELNRYGAQNIGFVVWDGLTSYNIDSDDIIPLNTWTHIIASFDGENIRLYIDGALQGQPVPAQMSTNTEPLYVGRAGRSYADQFVGQLDELKIWEGGASDTDALQLNSDSQPTISNKLRIGMEDLAGTLFNSVFFYIGVAMIVVIILTIIASILSLKAKKANLKYRFGQARKGGFSKVFEIAQGTQDQAAHIEGQDVLAGWKEAISTSPIAGSFIKPETLDLYALVQTKKVWGAMVFADKETESFTTEKREVSGSLPYIYDDPSPTALTDYTDYVVEYPVSGTTHTCPDCNELGDVECETCAGKKEIKCPDCGGNGVLECNACDMGSNSCPDCDGNGKHTCMYCGGEGQTGGSGRGRWITVIDNKGTHYVHESGYSERKSCFFCNGNGKVNCESCNGKGSTRCEKCGGMGNLDCNKCSTQGIIVCPDCVGSGRVTCSRCAGHTKISEVDYKIWTYKHHTMQEVNGDVPGDIREDEYKDPEIGSLEMDSLQASIPDQLEEKDTGNRMFAWAKARYSAWNVPGDKVIFQRFRAKLLPVTEIHVKSSANKDGATVFKLWAVGGKKRSRLHAQETPDAFNTSFTGHKMAFRFAVLAEMYFLTLLILKAFDIGMPPL